ncbi:MAG: hypothetical protein ACT4PT_07490, partial [Methanobacteriota archaeon]
LQTFNATRDRSDDLAAGVEYRLVADRVAARVLQAAEVATKYENATFAVDLQLPPGPRGGTFRVTLEPGKVLVEGIHNGVKVNATTFRVDALGIADVSGVALNENGNLVRVKYYKDTSKHIRLEDI